MRLMTLTLMISMIAKSKMKAERICEMFLAVKDFVFDTDTTWATIGNMAWR